MENRFGIIEIGSNNTKTHIYDGEEIVFENNTTIELKKNYAKENKIDNTDLEKLYSVIQNAKEYTQDLHIYGCSIFRKLSSEELDEINNILEEKFNVKVEVVTQEDEAKYTAMGCYKNIDYTGKICVFIGGGGSTELIFVDNGQIVDKKYFNFGVVDITNKFPSLREDIPSCTFDEVYGYIDELVGELDEKADILILAGGDHLYWYNNARFELIPNNIYTHSKQQYMITKDMSDNYDRLALEISLDEVKNRSDNPLWFDGARAMKVITNLISNRVDAKYIIPTKINMEDGIKSTL